MNAIRCRSGGAGSGDLPLGKREIREMANEPAADLVGRSRALAGSEQSPTSEGWQSPYPEPPTWAPKK